MGIAHIMPPRWCAFVRGWAFEVAEENYATLKLLEIFETGCEREHRPNAMAASRGQATPIVQMRDGTVQAGNSILQIRSVKRQDLATDTRYWGPGLPVHSRYPALTD